MSVDSVDWDPVNQYTVFSYVSGCSGAQVDLRVRDSSEQLSHSGNGSSTSWWEDVTDSNITSVSFWRDFKGVAYPIFAGSTPVRLIDSFRTAARRSSGRQSLNPPFLAYLSALNLHTPPIRCTMYTPYYQADDMAHGTRSILTHLCDWRPDCRTNDNIICRVDQEPSPTQGRQRRSNVLDSRSHLVLFVVLWPQKSKINWGEKAENKRDG